MQKTALALILFSQGIPILHAGMEFLRTKEIPEPILRENPEIKDYFESKKIIEHPLSGSDLATQIRSHYSDQTFPSGSDLSTQIRSHYSDQTFPTGSDLATQIRSHYSHYFHDPHLPRYFSHNSYNLGDSINALDWARCAEYQDVVVYAKGLIALRKALPHFRLQTEKEVQKSLAFVNAEGKKLKSSELKETVPFLAWVICLKDGAGLIENASQHGSLQSLLQKEIYQVYLVCNPQDCEISCYLPKRSAKNTQWNLLANGLEIIPIQSNQQGGTTVSKHKKIRKEILIPPKTLYLYGEF